MKHETFSHDPAIQAKAVEYITLLEADDGTPAHARAVGALFDRDLANLGFDPGRDIETTRAIRTIIGQVKEARDLQRSRPTTTLIDQIRAVERQLADLQDREANLRRAIERTEATVGTASSALDSVVTLVAKAPAVRHVLRDELEAIGARYPFNVPVPFC